MAEADQKITVLNIISVSFSGSTWINLMLGAHPEAFSVGEMKWIVMNNAALCGLHGESCPIWSQYDVKSDENPFVQVSCITGKKVLIVNNSKHFYPALDDPRIDAKYLRIIRDGRAVMASAMRKNPTQSSLWGINFWRKTFLRLQKRVSRLPQEKVMLLKYEACVQEPERIMTDVCNFIGIQYDPQMLDYDSQERHFIGGNLSVLGMVASKHDSSAVHILTPGSGRKTADIQEDQIKSDITFDLSHYKKMDSRKFVDERWKAELSDFQLFMFALRAGNLNRKYGYPPSMKR